MRDLMGMMKKAQELQTRMGEMQAELEQMTVEGVSGAGMVTVSMNGKGAMTGVTIDPSLIKADEAEILEDLILAAHNDAKAKVETAMQEKMKDLTGGMPLPPGLGGMFGG